MRPSEPLEILYQDSFFVAVNKPCGLLVHPSPIDKGEKRVAVRILRDQIGQRVYPVHRLDRPTSGVLLFALTSEAAGKTAQLFQTGRIRKKYIAVVRGYTEKSGTIDYRLKEIRDKRILRDDSKKETDYPAVTNYKRMATIELPFAVDKYQTSRYSLVALLPETGRRHQLRRHMKHIAHPIVGDTKHGQYAHNAFFKTRFNCGCLLLAAVELSFMHPVTGEAITITADINSEFRALLTKFNWNDYVSSSHPASSAYPQTASAPVAGCMINMPDAR
ncbi:MAG: pseudouridine synthase [Desulfobacterales bacterium]|nr:pseudouridine synthase [Desulfobacterales bacterium]MDD4071607.1 pseudouridine synthase [Desulfobacterales bacterium]MDD4392644.1 pseudouridine synthase [Desulfobacterales bacterium]